MSTLLERMIQRTRGPLSSLEPVTSPAFAAAPAAGPGWPRPAGPDRDPDGASADETGPAVSRRAPDRGGHPDRAPAGRWDQPPGEPPRSGYSDQVPGGRWGRPADRSPGRPPGGPAGQPARAWPPRLPADGDHAHGHGQAAFDPLPGPATGGAQAMPDPAPPTLRQPSPARPAPSGHPAAGHPDADDRGGPGPAAGPGPAGGSAGGAGIHLASAPEDLATGEPAGRAATGYGAADAAGAREPAAYGPSAAVIVPGPPPGWRPPDGTRAGRRAGPPPAPAGTAADAVAGPGPQITISIGHIEVRAAPAAPPAAKPAGRPPFRPQVSLADFLRQDRRP